MDYRLPNGTYLQNVPDDMTEEEIASIAQKNGLFSIEDLAPQQEVSDDPTVMENIKGLGIDLVGKGILQAVKSINDLVAWPMPDALEKSTTEPISEYLESGIETWENLKPEAYREVQKQTAVARDEEGNMIGLQAPSWQSIAGITLSSLPQIPAFIYGGGALMKGMKSVKWLASHPKVAQAIGYGTVNAALVAPGQWRDTYKEALDEGMTEDKAQEAADAAALLTAAVSGTTGGLGGVIASKMGAESSNFAKAIGKGFIAEAPFEGLEEAGQSMAGDIGMGRSIDPANAIESGLMGTLAGGVPGAGIAAVEHAGVSTKHREGLKRADLEEEKIRAEAALYQDKMSGKMDEILAQRGGYEAQPEAYFEEKTIDSDINDNLKKLKKKIQDGIDKAGYEEDAQEYIDLVIAQKQAMAEGNVDAIDDLGFERSELETFYVEEGILPEELVKDGGIDLLVDEDTMAADTAINIAAGAYAPPIRTLEKGSVRRKPVYEMTGDQYKKLKPLAKEVQSVLNKAGIGKDIKFELVQMIEDAVYVPNRKNPKARGNYIYGVKPRDAKDTDAEWFDEDGEFVYTKPDDDALGQFDPSIKTIFLAVDKAYVPNPDGTMPNAQQIKRNLLSTLDHEKVHALKTLDLFKQNEWDVLLKAAKKEKYQGDETYYDWAQENYKHLHEYGREEEAIAELIMGENKKKKGIGGRPRQLMDKIANFFEKLHNALKGSGFNSFQSIFGNIESGKIGGRQRGVVRSHRLARKTGNIDRIAEAYNPELKIIKGELVGLLNIEETRDMTPEEKQKVAELYNTWREGVEKAAESVGTDVDKTLTPETEKSREKAQQEIDQTFIGSLTPEQQAAFHGSGAIFDRFKTNHIGEGEGAQVRGWGLYFGQQEKTGKHYYEMLGKGRFLLNNKPIKNSVLASDNAVRLGLEYINDAEPNGYTWIEFRQKKLDQFNEMRELDEDSWSDSTIDFAEEYGFIAESELISELDRSEKLVVSKTLKKTKPSGGLYKVDIPDQVIEDMLDLDKPISQQSRRIQNIAKEIGFEEKVGDFNLTGEELRNEIEAMMLEKNMRDTGEAIVDESDMSAPKAASMFLLSRGVPGNKFDDGWTRNKRRQIWVDGVDYGGKNFEFPPDFTVDDEIEADMHISNVESGMALSDEISRASPKLKPFLKTIEIQEPELTQNYVVFDDNDVSIMEINGKPFKPKKELIVDAPSQQRRPPQNQGMGPPPAFNKPDDYGKFKKGVWYIQDKLIGLKDIEAEINKQREADGRAKLTARESAYIGEELSFGRIGEKVKEFHRDNIEPLIQAISASNVEIADLDEFLVLRHGIERNDRVRKIREDIPDGGAGSLGDNRLTDAFIKDEMLTRFGMRWDDATKTWTAPTTEQGIKLNNIATAYVDPMIKGTLDEALEGGLITQLDHSVLTGQGNPNGSFYKYYAPLRGFGTDMLSEIDADTNSRTAGSGGSISIEGKEIGRVKGRSSEAYSPLATLVHDRERTIARGVKNKDIDNRLYDLVVANPNNEVWEIIGPDNPRDDLVFESSYTYVGNDPSIGYGTKKTDIAGMPDPQNWVKRVGTKVMTTVNNARAEELIGVKVNGEQHYIDIKDKNLRKSLLNLDSTSQNQLVHTLGQINRMLSFVNTTLNPEFVIGNFSRDIQTAIASIIQEKNMEGGMLRELGTEKIVRKVLGKFGKNLFNSGKIFYQDQVNKSGRNTRNYTLNAQDQADIDEFLNAGGKADWFHTPPPEEQRANIQSLLDMQNGTFKGGAKKKVLAAKDFIENGNAAVENAVRFSTFKVARDAFMETGMNREEAVERAASMAKNMTINFNRKGEAGNTLNSVYLFFNAQVQGTAVVFRGLTGSKMKRQILGAITSMGMLMAMIHDWANDDEEEKGLEHVDDYVRERNMVIPGEWVGAKEDIKIPLPYGYNFFYQLGSNAYLMSQGKMSLAKGTTELTKTFLGSFNPIGAPGGENVLANLLKMALPTALTPAVELVANENYFGSPIYKENYQFGTPVPASHRTRKNTNRVFAWLTQGLNEIGGNESESGVVDINPDVISYLIGYGLGGAGSFGERTFIKPIGNVAEGKKPFAEYNDIPFVRRFIHEYTDRPDMTAFYDRRDKIAQKYSHIQNISGPERSEYLKQNIQFIRMKSTFQTVEKQLRKLRQQQKAIQSVIEKNPARAAELSANQERIEDLMDNLINKANKIYENEMRK